MRSDSMLPSIHRQYELLRIRVDSKSCSRLLEELQQKGKISQEFQTWAHVANFMQDGPIRRPETDEVLVPIFERMAATSNTQWQNILLFLFWSFLETEYRYGKHREPSEGLQNLFVAFLHSVQNINLDHRSTNLAQKLANDTIHHFQRFHHQFSNRRHRNIETNGDPKILEKEAEAPSTHLAIDGRDFQEWFRRQVLEAADRQVITKWGAEVMISTRLEGRQLKDLEFHDVSYDTAKRRRHREEARLISILPLWRKIVSAT